jgi:tetratricopeptide (TPR) repeat protein
VWATRGNAQAELGRYELAAADLARAIDEAPAPSGGWYLAALAQVAAGRDDEYRGLCRRLLDVAKGDKFVPQLVQTYSLLPDAVPDTDRLVRLAGQAPPDSIGARLAGRILYRAGRFRQAADRLQQSFRLRGNNPLYFPADYALVAMAHHRLGNAKEARRWLARARRQRDLRARKVATDPAAARAWDLWANPVADGLFFCEAEALIEGSPAEADPKQRLAFARAHARLGQWARALADYDLLLKERPKGTLFWLERGRVRERPGQNGPAAADFARAGELQAKELERLRAALDKAPDDPEGREALDVALHDLARIERQRGRPEKAAAALLQAQKLWPGDGPRLYEVAEEIAGLASAAGGPADDALAALHTALAAGFDGRDALRKAKAWAPLRARDDFRKLLAEFEARDRFPLPLPELRRFAGHGAGKVVTCVAVSPDGRRALSGSYDGSIRLWDLARGTELRAYDRFPAQALAVAFSPDGRKALIATTDRVVQLWDVETGRSLRDLSGHAGRVGAVAFLPDGRRALSGDNDGILRLWDLEIGREVRRLLGHQGAIYHLVVSADGCRALSGGHDGIVHLWDLGTGREVGRLRGHKDAVWSVAFSPDGHRGLSGGRDGVAILWDLDGAREIRRSSRAGKGVRDVAFAPGGRSALLVGYGCFQSWDLETGAELDLAGADGSHVRVAFLPDGCRALTADADALVRLWDLSEESARAARFLHAGRADRARSAYGDLLKRRPDDGWAALLRGRLHARAGRWAEAAADFTRAARSPDVAGDPEVWTDLGRCQALLARWDEAAASFARALELSPEAGRARLVGEVAAWDPALARLVKLRPGDAAVGRAALDRARARVRRFTDKGRWDEARTFVEAEQAGQPDDPDPLLLAAALHLEGAEQLRRHAAGGPAPGAGAREQQARVLYEKLLTLQPDNAAVAGELAGLLLLSERHWHVLDPVRVQSAGGATITRLPDGSVLAGGKNPFPETYTVTAKTNLAGITAVRLEVLADKSLPSGGPGRAGNGNFVLSEFKVEARLPGEAKPRAVELTRALADFSQGGYPVQNAIDGKLGTGWALLPQLGRDHAAIFGLKENLVTPAGTTLTFTLNQNHPEQGHNIGRFRLAVTTAPGPELLEWLARVERNGLTRLGLAYLARGEWQAALGPLQQATAAPTATANDHLLLALAHARLGKLNRARPAFARALDRLGRQRDELLCLLAAEALSPALERWPEDPDLLAYRARVREWLGRHDRAAADRDKLLAVLDRRLAADLHDVRDLWLRAEVYAGRGQWDQAAADLRRYFAAAKGPGSRWFQAGWWAIGPCPEDLKSAGAPESQTDPFRPVAAAGKIGPLSWRAAGPGEFLDLGALFNHADHISAYAQLRVYSPGRQAVALLVGADDAARVWLNGKLVHESPAYPLMTPDAEAGPALLQPGWNVLLARVTNWGGAHFLYLRLSAEPADLARALDVAGHWPDDEPSVQGLLASFPDRVPVLHAAASYYRRRAEELWQAGPGNPTPAARQAAKQARALYDKLASLRPESPYYRGELADFLRATAPDQALGFLNGEVSRHPGDPLPLRRRADLFAGRGRWKEAAANFARARALDPEDPENWYREAVAHLGGSDLPAYRRTCEAMLEHFKDTAQAWVASRVGYVCVPVPDAVEDRVRLLALARRAVPTHKGNCRLLGAALYRTGGDTAEAVRNLEEGTKDFHQGWDFLFLAMAHHRAGRATKARHYFDRACRWIEAADRRKAWVGWYERVETEYLRREAAALFDSRADRAAAR